MGTILGHGFKLGPGNLHMMPTSTDLTTSKIHTAAFNAFWIGETSGAQLQPNNITYVDVPTDQQGALPGERLISAQEMMFTCTLAQLSAEVIIQFSHGIQRTWGIPDNEDKIAQIYNEGIVGKGIKEFAKKFVFVEFDPEGFNPSSKLTSSVVVPYTWPTLETFSLAFDPNAAQMVENLSFVTRPRNVAGFLQTDDDGFPIDADGSKVTSGGTAATETKRVHWHTAFTAMLETTNPVYPSDLSIAEGL